MQKKIIALAVAALASGAALAQSNVTIYGIADVGVTNVNGNSGAINNARGVTSVASGVASGSRIGFKGAEDLGNGLKALFQMEYGVGLDQTSAAGTVAGTTVSGSTATWTNRNSFVGLTGGFGTVVAGRLDGVRYGIYNQYDPFQGGTVANFTQITRQVDRADNAIAYISPNFSGFTLTLATSTNIQGGESATGGNLRLATGMLGYENGPLSLKADYEQITVTGGNGAGLENGKIYVATFGGSYDFGVAKAFALFDTWKDDLGNATRDDKRSWLIGARAPFGKFTGKVSYGQVKDKLNANSDVSKFGIGVDYSLSKRTTIYADFAKISNDDNAFYSISAAPNAMGMMNTNVLVTGNTPAGAGTAGVRGIDFGIKHVF